MRHLSVSFAVALMLSTAAITPAPASTILAPGGLAAAESRAGVDIVDASELRGRSWIAIVVLAGLAALTIYLLTDARPRSRSARHNGFSGYRLTATVPGERRSLRLVLGRADPVLPRRASAPRDGK